MDYTLTAATGAVVAFAGEYLYLRKSQKWSKETKFPLQKINVHLETRRN
jgi:hypothetical protein